MKLNLFTAAVLAVALASTSALAAGQTQGKDATSVVPAAVRAITILNAVAATGTSICLPNPWYTAHSLAITTTSSPSYTIELDGYYDAACAGEKVVVFNSGSISTTPKTLRGAGYFPYIQANLVALSAGTLTAVYSGSSGASVDSDARGRAITGNSNRSTYWTSLTGTVPTAAAAIAAIEADASFKIRLRYVKVCLGVGALQTTAGERTIILYRTTAASSGGTASQTALTYDPADAAFGGILRYNSSAVTTTPAIGSTTIANSLWSATFALTTAATTTTPQCQTFTLDAGQMKPIIVAAGVVNGLALGDLTGGTGGAGNYNIDLGWTIE